MDASRPYAVIEDNSYCDLRSIDQGKGEVLEEKINEILSRVRRIDNSLICQPNQVPTSPKPIVPPKPGSRTLNSQEQSPQTLGRERLVSGSDSYLPPIPPKGAMQRGNMEKTFSKTQCDYLVVQLHHVREYFDEMVDDDFEEKHEKMQCLNDVIRVLTFSKR
ncbi:uncharacterized protein LOC143473136 [Clavelina lepadiformis]|uniref:Uncharacterized protein n=1 Tax=Clavelina lepadiformis TaxID=159417 RepID=A0ABP0G702_CLALP